MTTKCPSGHESSTIEITSKLRGASLSVVAELGRYTEHSAQSLLSLELARAVVSSSRTSACHCDEADMGAAKVRRETCPGGHDCGGKRIDATALLEAARADAARWRDHEWNLLNGLRRIVEEERDVARHARDIAAGLADALAKELAAVRLKLGNAIESANDLADKETSRADALELELASARSQLASIGLVKIIHVEIKS